MPAADDALARAAELAEQREPFALATVVACRRPTSAYPGAKAIIRPGGAFSGWVGGSCAQPLVLREALAAIEDGRPRLLRISPDPPAPGAVEEGVIELAMPCQSQGALEIYVEPVLPRPQLLVVGATPLAEALVRAGQLIGFEVSVSDPDATGERFPGADRIEPDLDEAARRAGAGSYVVVATQGQYDEEALAAALEAGAGYVGLVASSRRGAAVLDYLRESGFDAPALERLRCPAGLDLGAVTPGEIALSIAAELLELRRSGHEHAPAASADHDPAAAPTDPGASESVDPVCGMAVEIRSARHVSEHEGLAVYFCAASCRERFEREPGRYLPQTSPSREPA